MEIVIEAFRSGFLRYATERVNHVDGEGRLVPFIVEAASYPSEREEILEAVNFTASIYRPFTKWVWIDGGRKTQLRDLVRGKRLSVLLHLICPSITWLSPAKGELDLEPFMDSSSKVVTQVCRRGYYDRGSSRTRLPVYYECCAIVGRDLNPRSRTFSAQTRIGLWKQGGLFPQSFFA